MIGVWLLSFNRIYGVTTQIVLLITPNTHSINLFDVYSFIKNIIINLINYSMFDVIFFVDKKYLNFFHNTQDIGFC